jgi:O-antigen/teichoic acid export membrane protein
MASGIRWGLIDQIVQVVVRFASTVVLARLLVPKDFGVIGLALVVVNLALVFSGLSLGAAIVQLKELRPAHVTTAFTASALFGGALAGGVAAASIPAAAFFHQPRLHTLLPAISVTFVLRGLELTPNDVLLRRTRFRSYYLSSTIATVASASAGVALAVGGAGVWALAVMMIVDSGVACALAWVFALRERVWRPSLGLDAAAFRELFGFSGFVLGSELVSYGRGNGDNFVIGRVLGAKALGYYDLAYRMMLLPVDRFGEVVSVSVYPVMASLRDDLEEVWHRYRDALRLVSVVCFPVTIGIAMVAPLAVPPLLGRQWTGAVGALQVLALSGPLLGMNRLTSTLVRAVGRPNWGMWLNVVGLIVYVPGFLVGVHFGIKGVAVAFGAATVAMVPVELAMVGRALRRHWWDVIVSVCPIALATAVMVGAVEALLHLLPPTMSDGVTLAWVVGGGVVAYLGALSAAMPELVADGLRIAGRRRGAAR